MKNKTRYHTVRIVPKSNWKETKSMLLEGTYKVRNEIETKRNETKRNEINENETTWNETKRNQQKRNETKRNQRNENEIKRNQRNQRKQNEIRC